MKRTPLIRKKPLRPKRATPRNRKFTVRITGLDMEALREHVYYRENTRLRCFHCHVELEHTKGIKQEEQ